MSTIIGGSSPSVTFPDSTVQDTSAIISGKVPYANLPAGSVLQVVQTAYSTVSTTSSASLVSTGCTASITPKFSTSKILAIMNMSTWHSNNNQQVAGAISRNSGAAQSGQSQDFYNATGSGVAGNISTVWLDSPSTTSSVTYTVLFSNDGSNNATAIAINKDYNGTNNGVTYLTLMEIAG